MSGAGRSRIVAEVDFGTNGASKVSCACPTRFTVPPTASFRFQSCCCGTEMGHGPVRFRAPTATNTKVRSRCATSPSHWIPRGSGAA